MSPKAIIHDDSDDTLEFLFRLPHMSHVLPARRQDVVLKVRHTGKLKKMLQSLRGQSYLSTCFDSKLRVQTGRLCLTVKPMDVLLT